MLNRHWLVFRTGFTLIELLVVIAVIAILMVVTVIILNPGELLKQSRDSNRLSDMATLKNALALYMTDVSVPSLGTKGTCYTYMASSGGATPCIWFTTASTTTNVSSSRAVDGAGWIPVNFQLISAGLPIRQIPVDPIANSTSTFYSYATNGATLFKLAAKMESIKFNFNGSGDVVSKDGGLSTSTYETGPGAPTL